MALDAATIGLIRIDYEESDLTVACGRRYKRTRAGSTRTGA